MVMSNVEESLVRIRMRSHGWDSVGTEDSLESRLPKISFTQVQQEIRSGQLVVSFGFWLKTLGPANGKVDIRYVNLYICIVFVIFYYVIFFCHLVFKLIYRF